jgi:hypothetical protein
MATLYITEFGTLQADPFGPAMPAAVAPSLADQTVVITGASAQSAAFTPGTRLVRLMADSVCSVKFGANPAASVTTMRLASNVPEYFQVPAGQSFKVAVIANT